MTLTNHHLRFALIQVNSDFIPKLPTEQQENGQPSFEKHEPPVSGLELEENEDSEGLIPPAGKDCPIRVMGR